MHAVVTGMIATYPVGGVLWDYGQYAMGLEQLGFDVWYLEDTGGQTYDPRIGYYVDDPTYAVDFLRSALRDLSPSLGERWHFVDANGASHGVPSAEMHDIIATADVFLNVSGGTLLRDAYMASPRKIMIDTDPGWNHFVNFPKWDSSPGWQGTHGYRAHDAFFTYAERIGRPGCRLPDLGLDWRTTRPPVLCERWHPDGGGDAWTTVMTWDNFRRTIENDGVTYGTKEMEFPKFATIPGLVPATFEVAVGGTGGHPSRWQDLGWRVVDSYSVSTTPAVYRDYIQRSRGEFSVAKNVYVATRSGWFSCRSICYLAAGRPVVIQDTGFSDVVPTGAGLFAFETLEDAVAAVRRVEDDYDANAEAAREIARTHFAAPTVIARMLDEAGVS